MSGAGRLVFGLALLVGSLAAVTPAPAQSGQAAEPATAPAASTPGPGRGPSITGADATLLLGMTLAEAYAALGVPEEVFSFRGAEGWQDDVVFYYPGGLYLFWYANRVWQARADARFVGPFQGLSMGWTREQVVAVVGRPFQELSDSIVFLLPDASQLPASGGRNRGTYPIRLRAFFRDGRLQDLYLYRGDF